MGKGAVKRGARTIVLAPFGPVESVNGRLVRGPDGRERRGVGNQDDGGWLHAVPIAWKGGATFPVRAYVMSEK